MEFKKYFLKDLVENFSVRAKDYGGASNLEFLGVSNEDGIVQSKYAAEEKAEDYKIIEKGCFAYNPYRINVGSIAYFAEDIKGLISPAYVIFKTKPNKINDKILLKFLKSSEGLRQIKLNARGTVRQALRFEDLCKIEISIPQYDEQELLISKIENVEIKNEFVSSELANQLNIIKQLRQSFLREAMQGKLVSNDTKDGKTGAKLLAEIQSEKEKLIKEKKVKKSKPLSPISEEEIPFEIPENWVWCRLGEILNIKSGKRIHASDYRNEGVPFLRSGEIGSLGRGEKLKTELFISQTKYNEIKAKFGIPKSGDILIACIGGSIGNTWIVDEREFYYKDGNLVLIESIPNINYNYLLYYLKSPFFWNNTILNATDSSYNALTIIKLNQSEFPLPPLHEQEQIVAKLEELMTFCDGLEQSIKESQGYNEMLLQQVLREALQPKEKEVVLPLVAEDREEYKVSKESGKICDNGDMTILAGYIIKKLSTSNPKDFGRVKLQKMLHLAEYHCKLETELHYKKNVAGPYAWELENAIEPKLKTYRYFDIKQDKFSLYNKVTYTALANAKELDFLFQKQFAEISANINSLLDKFNNKTWEFCEMISTMYAVWNNRILKNQNINKEELKKDFLDWDEKKVKYQDQLYYAIEWMEKENLVPIGFGKYIEK